MATRHAADWPGTQDVALDMPSEPVDVYDRMRIVIIVGDHVSPTRLHFNHRTTYKFTHASPYYPSARAQVDTRRNNHCFLPATPAKEERGLMKSSLPTSRPPPKADAVGCDKQRVTESLLMSSCAGQFQHVVDGKGTFSVG